MQKKRKNVFGKEKISHFLVLQYIGQNIHGKRLKSAIKARKVRKYKISVEKTPQIERYKDNTLPLNS